MHLVPNQNRKFPRQALTRPVSASLVVAGRPFESNIIDYSFLGFKVRTSDSALKSINRDKNDVQLSLGSQNFACRVCHSQKSKGSVVIGVNLPELARESALSFTTNDPGWDLIEDPETLQNLWADLVFKGPEVLIELKQISAKATLIAKKVREDNRLVAEIHELERGRLAIGSGSFQFEIFQTCHAFDTRVTAVSEKEIELELPKAIARLLRRETFRVLNGTNEKRLTVELSSSILGKSEQPLEVYDFSEHGISVLDPSGWIFAPPGVPIESITIRISGGAIIQGHGSIRGYRWIPEKNAYSVGLDFQTSSGEHKTVWHNTILEARYPTLSFWYKPENDHANIWKLFERSGYLDLKSREAFTHVYDVTKDSWKKLGATETTYAKRIILRAEDNIVGHMQMDRIYPDTWCLHHLAIDPQTQKIVGKEIYSVATDVLLAENAKYLISLTDAGKPWNQRNYYDFIKAYRYPNQNELKIYQIYEADLGHNISLKKAPDIEIRKAGKYDLKRIARYFEVYGTDLERNACGLDNNHLTLSQLHSEISPFGLSRGREFVLAFRGNEMLGFARIETGTLGVNIFGLLDMLYVHLMPNLGERTNEIHETLVSAGLDQFRELERKDVIVALDDNRSEYYNEKGLTYIWAGARWIAMREILPRYHAYTQMLYGHLLTRREKIRSRHKKD